MSVPGVSNLGAGTEEIGLRTYKFVSSYKKHSDAISNCVSMGATLALPTVTWL